MRNSLFFPVLSLLLLSACTADLNVKQVTAPPTATTGPIFKGEKLDFAKLQIKLARGEKYGEASGGWACVNPQPLTWSGGTQNLTEGSLFSSITTELRSAGLSVSAQSEELFSNATTTNSDLVLGAIVTTMDMKVCASVSGVKGAAYTKVDWQLFSKSQKRIVYQVTTEGSWKNESFVTGTQNAVLPKTLAIATQHLVASPEFRKLLVQ